MQIGTEANSRSMTDDTRARITMREIWSILAEGGMSASYGVEWLLDNIDRRAEGRA